MMPFRTAIGRVAAQLPDPLLRVDDAGWVIWRNDRFRELAEGDGPTLLGRRLRELAHPEDRGVVQASLTDLAGGAGSAAALVRVRLADGSSPQCELKFLRMPSFESHEPFVTVLLRVAA